MQAMPREAALFVNEGSRTGETLFADAKSQLLDCGWELPQAKLVPPAELAETIKASEQEIIFIGGGDGTMQIAAGAMINSPKTLGILPLGTGNALARDLGIPIKLNDACTYAWDAQPRLVDVALANDRVFVNLASIGLVGDIARRLEPNMKKLIGRAAYVRPLVDALEAAQPFHVSIETRGRTESFQTLLIAVGCGATQGGIIPLPGEAGIGTGKLTIYSLKSADLTEYIELLWKMATGSAHEIDDLYLEEAEIVRISVAPGQEVIFDGEGAGPTPVNIEVRPRALRVLASRPTEAP